MFCTNCGQPRPDDATTCPSCGKRIPKFAPREPVPNYLVPAAIVTIACCLPLGIVAVVYAAQVNNKLAVGDIAGAKAASAKVKMWSWIGFASALIIPALWLIMMAVAFMSS